MEAALSIRRLTEHDAPAYLDFLHAIGQCKAELSDDPQKCLAQARRTLRLKWTIAALHERIAGLMAMNIPDQEAGKEPPWLLYLTNVNVLPIFRRQGIARSLLHHVLREVDRAPYFSGISLHVDVANEPAIALYEQAGFTKRDTEILTIEPNVDLTCFLMQRDKK